MCGVDGGASYLGPFFVANARLPRRGGRLIFAPSLPPTGRRKKLQRHPGIIDEKRGERVVRFPEL